MRVRKKKNLLPRMERVGALLTTPDTLKGRWRSAIMPDATALHAELGCGMGSFCYSAADSNPGILFVAAERVPDVIVVAMEKALAAALPNLRFVLADAAAFADWFADGELDRLYINFCDPWPQKKRAKRRLTHENYLNLYKKALSPDGELWFKTDNSALFDFSLEELTRLGWRIGSVCRDLHATAPVPGDFTTEYEQRFSSQGVAINRLTARPPLN